MVGINKINEGEEDEMVIEGFRRSYLKILLTGVLLLLSGGTLLILLSWKSKLRLIMTHSRCPLQTAYKILLTDCYKQEYVHNIVQDNLPYFYNKHLKYTWKIEQNNFVKVIGLETGVCSEIHELSRGLSAAQASARLKLYGENTIQVDVKPVWQLIINEIKGPFYIYQLFIVIIWSIQIYYEFALCIVLLSVISVSATVWETRKQSMALRDAVHSQSTTTILRDGVEVETSSVNLVPGDIIVLGESEITIECDAILLSGNCVVNESMLTGESIPIKKVPLSESSDLLYSINQHKRNTLFCGTQILYARTFDSSKVKAVVIRTGFATAKGELVRAILFPKPIDFKLYSDLFKSMICFLILGLPAMLYSAFVWTRTGALVKDVVIIVLDVATFVVPPILPAVLTSINAHAQRRLRKHGIFCLNSRYINFCGGLDIVCFDKTGTLTEDGLNLAGVIPVEDSRFLSVVKDFDSQVPSQLILAMATCHSLALVNNLPIGYTLDVKMFQTIGWILMESQADENSVPVFEKNPPRIVCPPSRYKNEVCSFVAILKEFPFESILRRMTVITQIAISKEFNVFTKGAPEMIQTLCNSATVPDNFEEILESHTRQGYRVLAVASKLLHDLNWDEAMALSRESLESDLRFEGFLILQNPLKPETLPALKILKDANIRNIMITGDNILTALTVASECGMIEQEDSVITVEIDSNSRVYYKCAKYPGYSEKLAMHHNGSLDNLYISLLHEEKFHLAMEGKTFDKIRTSSNQQLLNKVLERGTIFSRMYPEQKLNLIECLQKVGHQVGMCGDGANDCGALKTAHAGVSLSMAEASVASPFTSKVQNITCVPTLMREGRAALTGTFGVFRYMVCYCFVLLSAVLIMFWDGQKPSDGAYVMIDIVLSLLPPFVFGSTRAYPTLSPRRPTRSILSFLPQLSMFSFILIQILTYTIAYYYCIAQPWYEPFEFVLENTHRSKPSHVGSTILAVNMMSYVIASVIFSPGPPYRKNFLTNKAYLCVVVFNFALVSYLCLCPPTFMLKWMNMKRAPFEEYHYVLYSFSIANFIFCYIWEVFFVQGILFKFLVPVLKSLRGTVHIYEDIELLLEADKQWPPIGKYENLHPELDDKRTDRSTSWIGKWTDTQNGDSQWNNKKTMTFATFQDGQISNKTMSQNYDDAFV